jgi:Holliday junction resolvase RusA-like endonuclease
MSKWLDSEWDADEPVRLVEPAPEPPAWLGKACVWGPAQSQGSKRGFIHPQLKRVVIVDDNDKALKSWRQELVEAMLRCKPPEPLNSAVAVSVAIYVPRPQAHYRTGEHAGELKPNAAKVPAAGRDIDKIARAILDAGQIARWWTNDARVADLRLRRRYDDGIGERTWVFAWKLDYPDQPQPELPEVMELGEDHNYSNDY